MFQNGFSIVSSQEDKETINKISAAAFYLSCAVHDFTNPAYTRNNKVDLEKYIKSKIAELIQYNNLVKDNIVLTNYLYFYLNCCSSLTKISHSGLEHYNFMNTLRTRTSQLEEYSDVIETQSAAHAYMVQKTLKQFEQQ